MIRSFKSKRLREFRETGDARGINPAFLGKLRRELDALDEAEEVLQLDIPGFGLHRLMGDRKGQWSLTVSRNWRMTFRFEDGDVFDVDSEDYH